MSKPKTYIATKQIFINGVLHEPGQQVTVYELDQTKVADEEAAKFGDGLVDPKDFDPSMIEVPNAGIFAAPKAIMEPAVDTSVGKLPESDAVDAGIIVEDEPKPRAAKKSAALD